MPVRAPAPTGLNAPLAGTPPRRRNSIRRTSNIDVRIGPDNGMTMKGAVRDAVTDGGGAIAVLEQRSLTASIDADRVLRQLETHPDAVADLAGVHVGRGFRSTVRTLLPTDAVRSTNLGTLFDDLPVAVMLAAYDGFMAGRAWNERAEPGTLVADICSGWREDGLMVRSLRATGTMPIPGGPEATSLASRDAKSWHELPLLAARTVRRQRLLEVATDSIEPHPVYAMFRDSHANEDGRTTILHEWSITADYDEATRRLANVHATPHVLPWDECPAAAMSATRISGKSIDELADLLRNDFRGTSTCTHLNDLIGAMTALPALMSAVRIRGIEQAGQ